MPHGQFISLKRHLFEQCKIRDSNMVMVRYRVRNCDKLRLWHWRILSMSVVAPGYGGLSYGQFWTSTPSD